MKPSALATIQKSRVLKPEGGEKRRGLLAEASGTPALLRGPCGSGCSGKDGWVQGVEILPHPGWELWKRRQRRKRKTVREGKGGEKEGWMGKEQQTETSGDQTAVTRTLTQSGKNSVAYCNLSFDTFIINWARPSYYVR